MVLTALYRRYRLRRHTNGTSLKTENRLTTKFVESFPLFLFPTSADSSLLLQQMAKELFAGFAAAEADKLIETKGLDFIDREEAQRSARRQAENSTLSSLHLSILSS